MGSLKEFRDAIGYPQEDRNASERYALTGGLNIENISAQGDPGSLLYCNNYEPNFQGGYISKGGFEPVDGLAQTSAWVYQAVQMNITNASRIPDIGGDVGTNTISVKHLFFLGTQNVGGITYYVFTLLLDSLFTAYYGSDDYKHGVLTNGTSLNDGVLGQVFGTVTSDAISFSDTSLSYSLIAKARDVVRGFCDPVGVDQGTFPPTTDATGKALGVFDWNGYLFAIRKDAIGNFSNLYYATGSGGWTKVALGFILYFRLNTVQVNVGDTLTGATSGATAVVQNIVNMFGTVGGGDATGYISGTVTTGTFSANEFLKVGATNVAKTPASGNILVNNSLPPTGSFRFRRWSFGGVANNVRVYGVTGQGVGFELSFFDTNPPTGADAAVCLTPLITGIGLTSATFNAVPNVDRPTHIAAWQDQLFLGYPGGNLLHSGYQMPTNWTAVQGADTRALGEDITNMVEDVNNAMLITTRNRIRMLYGDVNENFQLRDIATTYGAYADTAQRVGGNVAFLTDEGVMLLTQSSQFGNFAASSISKPVAGLLKRLTISGDGVVEATVSRSRNMYRLYFDGGVCLSFCVVGDELVGIGMCDYGQNVSHFWSAASTIAVNNFTNASPPERIYMCGDDGFVYEDDVGATFGAEGRAIYFAGQTQFYYGQQNIDIEKYYRRVYIDVFGVDAYTNLQIGAEYDDGYGYRTPEVLETITRNLTGSVFDQNSVYGIGFYGGAGRNVIRKELHNQGVAISLFFSGTSKVAFPHTIQSASINYEVRARRHWR